MRDVEMSMAIKKMPPALRHGGYSATGILPGESPAEFAKLHHELIAEWAPTGALEDDVIAAMALALWRKRNLATLRAAKLAQERMAQIHSAMVPGVGEDPSSDQANQVERTVLERCRAAQERARLELGERYALVELGEVATIDHLVTELQVMERLDGIIDRCLKRLLVVRGVKSISNRSDKPISGPQEVYN